MAYALPGRVIFSFAYGGEEIWSHLASTVCGQACSQLNSRIFARRSFAVELDRGLMTISTLALKRFMPVARGTRPAYRNKTRGVLVFGDTPT